MARKAFPQWVDLWEVLWEVQWEALSLGIPLALFPKCPNSTVLERLEGRERLWGSRFSNPNPSNPNPSNPNSNSGIGHTWTVGAISGEWRR